MRRDFEPAPNESKQATDRIKAAVSGLRTIHPNHPDYEQIQTIIMELESLLEV